MSEDQNPFKPKAYCRVEGVAGFLVSPPKSAPYYMGFFWDDPSPQNPPNIVIPYNDTSRSFWICGAFEAWGRGRPRVKRAWNVLEMWLEAPDRATALERLSDGVLSEYLPKMRKVTGFDQFDEVLEKAIRQVPLLQCAVNTPARELHGFQKRDPAREDSYYICVQRLRPGFNSECFAYHPEHRVEAIARQEERIRLGTRKLHLKFSKLPRDVQRRITVYKRSGCWIWNPKKNWDGKVSSLSNSYGSMKYEGRQWQAHRLVYSLLGGKIPNEAVLRHQCHRKRCTNPAHILTGSHRENRLDTTRRYKRQN